MHSKMSSSLSFPFSHLDTHLFFVGDIVGLFVDGALVVGEVDGGNDGDEEGFAVVVFGVGETLGGSSEANTEIC